jgi:putative protein-disulfide isomerase
MTDPSPLWKHLQAIGLVAPAPTALYFADPMCSWCWGFSPVIAGLAERYRDAISIHFVMGGLRAGNTVPTDGPFREEILHHWQAVRECTGQPFLFDGALPDGFVYDTEPACRAVVTMAELESARTLGFLRSLQQAFYAEGRDITRSDVLAGIADQNGVDRDRFLQAFHLPEFQDKTVTHFQLSRDFGVHGFPTVALVDEQAATLLTAGYASIETLTPRIEDWLKRMRDSRIQDA